jgi:hypothetical protein
MSTNQKTWTDGEAITTTESNRVARIAATMDDRAWEGLLTPGSIQKRIVPLSEEALTVFSRTLLVPGVTAGSVKLQPALLLAGGIALPNRINMAAKLEAALDSATFASNSSGSTRYDLVYATISYAVSATGSRKVKDIVTAQVTTQVLNLEKATQVVLTVLPNVGNVTPTATMPADPGDGSSYNFPLCLVTLVNGYTGGTVITQSQIAQLWFGGFIQPQRVRGMRPMSIYAGAGGEKPAGALPAQERWGSDVRFFGHFKLVTATPNSTPPGDIIDNSIDWRGRLIQLQILYMGGALSVGPLDTYGSNVTVTANLSAGYAQSSNFATTLNFANVGGGHAIIALTYATGSVLTVYVHTDGTLRVYRSTLQDGTNGDLFMMVASATDQFKTGM